VRPGVPTRRDVLRWWGGAGLVTMSVSACQFLSTDPEAADPRPRQSAKGKEAPALAEQVKAGKLPPLAQRLPRSPRVIEPVERVGVYGGEWNTAVLGPSDTAWAYRTIGYEHLLNWDVEWRAPIPNIAESVEVDPEGRVFTFHLRPGMRWSDGEPFTADDIVFAHDDVYYNVDLSPQAPNWLLAGGRPSTVEKVDDHTVRFVFSVPNGLFLENIAQPAGEGLTNKPRHYLEQFHRTYNPDVDQLAREHDLPDWIELFNVMANPFERVGLPRLTAWVVTEPLGSGTRMVAERNPYYWKTDPDGSQLPYIDRVVYEVVNDEQTMVLKGTAGELDMHDRHITSPQNKPVLAAGRREGGYHFVDEVGSSMNSMVIALNLTHRDPALRAVFQDKNVRIGLSHAIDREDLIAAVFQRQGEPWQAAPRPESEFFDEELAKQYTEFDVDLANDHLDRAGLNRRDRQGRRLRPDGEPLRFQVDVATGLVPAWVDALELIRGYWAAVGVEMRVNAIDRDLAYERKEANSHDATVWGGDAGLADAVLDPRWYFPHSLESSYAVAWANLFNNATPREEPPAPTRRQMELYRQLLVTAEPEERAALFRQILQITKEEFYTIGTVLPPTGYAIVKDDFHNVPDRLLNAWMYPGPGPAMPEQFFIAES
jgi:peptide/nickel transport system substrate-binding protein